MTYSSVWGGQTLIEGREISKLTPDAPPPPTRHHSLLSPSSIDWLLPLLLEYTAARAYRKFSNSLDSVIAYRMMDSVHPRGWWWWDCPVIDWKSRVSYCMHGCDPATAFGIVGRWARVNISRMWSVYIGRRCCYKTVGEFFIPRVLGV